MGLSGVRRVSDEFHMDSGNGNGTTVIAKKWLAS
jgi:anti-sigma regulatory factor (Ser/Thr protein kinase)